MTATRDTRLRLDCFKALEGWGTRSEDESGLVKPWNWTQRLERAEALARWAEGSDTDTADDVPIMTDADLGLEPT